jgi:hypothetical protein
MYVSEAKHDKNICGHNKQNNASSFSLFAYTMRKREKKTVIFFALSMPVRISNLCFLYSVSLSLSSSLMFDSVDVRYRQALLEFVLQRDR